MADTQTELVLRDGQSIIDAHTLLKRPVEQLDDETVLLAWSLIDAVEKTLFKDRKAALRVALIEAAEEAGTKGSKSTVFELAGGKVTVQHKRGKVKYDLAKLRALMKSKGLDDNTVVKVTYTVDDKAVERLVDEGMLSTEELQTFTDIAKGVDALVVEKPPVVKGLLAAG